MEVGGAAALAGEKICAVNKLTGVIRLFYAISSGYSCVLFVYLNFIGKLSGCF